jgi:hypothetical protein
LVGYKYVTNCYWGDPSSHGILLDLKIQILRTEVQAYSQGRANKREDPRILNLVFHVSRAAG